MQKKEVKAQDSIETKKRNISQRLNLLLPEEIELLIKELNEKDIWMGYLIGKYDEANRTLRDIFHRFDSWIYNISPGVHGAHV